LGGPDCGLSFYLDTIDIHEYELDEFEAIPVAIYKELSLDEAIDLFWRHHYGS
jgi:hypothetical protein